MRTLFLVAIVISTFTSCKSPLPVYFDQPVGMAKDTFPQNIQGNYYPMDQILRDGLASFESKYYVKNGKAVSRDTTKAENIPNTTSQEQNQNSEKPSAVEPAKEEENNFYKIAKLNSLSISHIDSPVDSIDRMFKIVFAFMKITKDKITLVIRDSSEHEHESLLLQLGAAIKLTSYSDECYLNLKTPFGWELIKIEEWNRGEFVNMIPFYFTNYNDKSGDVNVFLKSTAEIYPNLKPIYDADHFIIGLKAVTDPKTIKEKFKLVESNLELVKVKEEE